MRFNRHLEKLVALARPRLPPEVLLPELVYFVGRVLKASALPAFLVSAPGRPVEDFSVWRGSELVVQGLRQMLAAGFWPAPPSVPSLATLLSRPGDSRVHAGTLWGEGCVEEGPWGPLWQAQGVRHGLQGVCQDSSGRIGVMLVSRDSGSPPFSADDLAFVTAAVPVLEAAMEPTVACADPPDSLAQQIHFLFDHTGRLVSAGVLGLEALRDIGGGGPDGVALGRQQLETVAVLLATDATGAGSSFDDQMATIAFGDADKAVTSARSREFARNAFGAFELSLHPIIGLQDGSRTILGLLKRFEPALLLAVHGASTSTLSARETDLLLALVMGDTLKAAAARMQVSYTTAKTLLGRLMGRFEVTDRSGLLNAALSIGRGDDLYAHWNQPI
jgi:DNA-binding CsgD family transcriptional regulator